MSVFPGSFSLANFIEDRVMCLKVFDLGSF